MVDMKITLLVFFDFLSVYYFTGIIDWLSTGGTRTMGYAMRLAVCRPEAHHRVRDFEHTSLPETVSLPSVICFAERQMKPKSVKC
jgi:hypothetical protein